jgi:hypothetical protein
MQTLAADVDPDTLDDQQQQHLRRALALLKRGRFNEVLAAVEQTLSLDQLSAVDRLNALLLAVRFAFYHNLSNKMTIHVRAFMDLWNSLGMGMGRQKINLKK